MLSEDLRERQGLPDALRVLVENLPRDVWTTHPQFGGMVQFWMERHMMFRKLTDLLRADIRALRTGEMDHVTYAPRLARLGETLINELHAHHHIEDSHYFPLLVGLDSRVSRGFDLLEADHSVLDPMIDALADGANGLLQPKDWRADPGLFDDQLSAFATLLNRHLTDEEEIVVPVILASGFEG